MFSHTYRGIHTLNHLIAGKYGVNWISDCKFWYSKAAHLFLKMCVSVCLCSGAHLCLWSVNMPKSTQNANFDSSVSNKLAVSLPDMQDFSPKHFMINHTWDNNYWGIYYSLNPHHFPHLSTYSHLSPNAFFDSFILSGLPLFWEQYIFAVSKGERRESPNLHILLLLLVLTVWSLLNA